MSYGNDTLGGSGFGSLTTDGTPKTSKESEPVDAVKDLLEKQDSNVWTNADPVIEYVFEVPFSEKGPGDGQPAELFVWQPVDSDISKLTAEGRYLDEDHNVEVQIWTLTESETMEYARDVIQIFGDFLDNQQNVSEFITLPPTSTRDLRSDKLPRKTSHYLATVEISPRKLSEAGT